VADAPSEGWCDEGAGCPPTRGLPETVYFVMLVGGVLLTFVALAAMYAAVIRRSEGLD
jgi:TRAP-type C4-dicarboxylate transport system permease small subunit